MRQHKEISTPEELDKPALPKLRGELSLHKTPVCQRGLRLRPPSILGKPEEVGEVVVDIEVKSQSSLKEMETRVEESILWFTEAQKSINQDNSILFSGGTKAFRT